MRASVSSRWPLTMAGTPLYETTFRPGSASGGAVVLLGGAMVLLFAGASCGGRLWLWDALTAPTSGKAVGGGATPVELCSARRTARDRPQV